jgi:predicted dienelactone hydrolase
MLRRCLALAALAACSTAATADTEPAGSTGGDTGAPTAPPTTGDLPTGEASETGLTTGDVAAVDYTMPGPSPVGDASFELVVGERTLLVELWYPADAAATAAAAAGHPIAEFVPEGPDRDVLDGLLADLSPHGQIGTRLQTRSARDAGPAADGPWPLIVFSHCHHCVRFEAFTVAERLASHGFLVAAPDHAGNTLFDDLAGDGVDLGEDFLQVRRDDMIAVLDAVLDPDHPAVPAALRGRADPGRVGALGHSFGAVTVGRLAQEDPRVRAALPIAAPVENPLFPGNHLADIAVPLLMIKAEEDNSILAIGNNLIETNFKDANPPVRIVRVADAGHWNFTDICGLVPGFDPGCGEGERQTVPGEPFTYLDIDVGRSIAASYALAFFDLHLRAAPDAAAFLDAPWPPDIVEVERRE